MKNGNINTKLVLLGLVLLLSLSSIHGQVDTGGTKRTSDHTKQVIGYITNWDAWKGASAGYPSTGALTQLNIDYSKYTILNFSFFGVAVDGSMHSADLRNKEIYKDGVVQQPADLLYTDIYSSWDLYILFGEIDPVQYINKDVVLRATAQGFDVVENGTTWSNPSWGIYNKPLPLPLKKEGGAKGLFELAKENGVKVMASIGGWSMSKHFADVAADPVKRARFVEDCKVLIAMGFDGIDLDWEFIGPFPGMNCIGTQADYTNFAILVEEIRAAIGPNKLITAALAQTEQKLKDFDWPRLDASMDLFNFMTYDFNGGWSNIAGHNSPLYDYPGQEWAGFSLNDCTEVLLRLGVPKNKINLGMAFYGRSVICDPAIGPAGLNAPTLKRSETIQPDGPISTCADYDNFKAFDGTPNYETIRQVTGFGTTGGWTKHWDDIAKVPYLTNGKYFISYDDEQSIALKSQYIVDNGLAGTIIWQVFGDLEFGGTVTNFGTKLKRWSDMKSPLVNKVNEVFASKPVIRPTVEITSPTNDSQFILGAPVTITANASDADGTVIEVAFYSNGTLISKDTAAPYTATFTPADYGIYSITAKATDNDNATTTTAPVAIRAISDQPLPPTVSIVSPANGTLIKVGDVLTIEANANDIDGNVVSVEFFNGLTSLGVDGIAPYSIDVNSLPEGIHTITAKVTDDTSPTPLTATSAPVTVEAVLVICTHEPYVPGKTYVEGDIVIHNGEHWICGWWTTAEPGTTGEWGAWQIYHDCGTIIIPPDELPVVTLTSDKNSVLINETVLLTANATDDKGIVSVEFFNGTTSLGVDTTAPYTMQFSSSVIGNYSITAVATDTGSQTAASSPLAISVEETVNPAPVVSINTNATAYHEGDVVTVTAAATDNSVVASVEFFNGTTSLGVFTQAPYSVTFTAVAGPMELKAIATDDLGKTGESNVITLTVTGNTPVVDPWAPGVLYKVGDLVTYDGFTWKNNREHTSNEAWYPGAPGLWFWDKQ